MTRYVALDVGTPNRMNNRMSAIGITVIEDVKIADEYYFNKLGSFLIFTKTHLSVSRCCSIPNHVFITKGEESLQSFSGYSISAITP